MLTTTGVIAGCVRGGGGGGGGSVCKRLVPVWLPAPPQPGSIANPSRSMNKSNRTLTVAVARPKLYSGQLRRLIADQISRFCAKVCLPIAVFITHSFVSQKRQ